MTRAEQVEFLIDFLVGEMPGYREEAERAPRTPEGRRRLLRGLMNVRPPMPLDPGFLRVQDALLSAEREERGVVAPDSVPVSADPRIRLWQGDITRLAADAIVDADNSALLGCFIPCHNCIDNAIHSAAGLQLRDECSRLMKAQGHEEPVGRAKLTGGYNLPAEYVLHTVGPAVSGAPTAEDRRALASCYRACLALAREKGLRSVAFCCISTGVFGFPKSEAAAVAVSTVREELARPGSPQVIFDVYKSADLELYRRALGEA